MAKCSSNSNKKTTSKKSTKKSASKKSMPMDKAMDKKQSMAMMKDILTNRQ